MAYPIKSRRGRSVTLSTEHITEAIINRFESLNAVRDRALAEARTIVRLSANSVRAIHRGQIDEATAQLGVAAAQVDELRESTRQFGSIYWAGYVQDAMKEYRRSSNHARHCEKRANSRPGPTRRGRSCVSECHGGSRQRATPADP